MSLHRNHNDIVASVLDLQKCEILATATGRLLHTHFGASHKDWSATKMRGLLVYGRDRNTYDSDGTHPSYTANHWTGYWFQLIEPRKRKVIWSLPLRGEYYLDRPFFHVVPGSSHLWGILFDDDKEAAYMFQKVTAVLPDYQHREHRRGRTRRSSQSDHSRPSKTRVSSPQPGTFVHVAHVGINKNGIIETTASIDPSWITLLQEMQGQGISKQTVEENREFVEGFLAGARTAKTSVSNSSNDTHESQGPLPPVPPKKIRRKPAVEFQP